MHIGATQASMNTPEAKRNQITCNTEECIAHYNNEYDKLKSAIIDECSGNNDSYLPDQIKTFKTYKKDRCFQLLEVFKKIDATLESSNRPRHDHLLGRIPYKHCAGFIDIYSDFYFLLESWENEKKRLIVEKN